MPENSSREKFKALVEAGDDQARQGKWDEAIRSYESALAEISSREVHERLVRMQINKRDKKGYLAALDRYKQSANPVKPPPPPPQAASAPPPNVPAPPSAPSVPASSSAPLIPRPSPPAAGPPPVSKPVTEADMAEAEARNWEREGKLEPASKLYLQAATLWEESGESEKATVAYEQSYEMSPSMDILLKLNQLYGLGAKIKQSTVLEIYRKIYHMKV